MAELTESRETDRVEIVNRYYIQIRDVIIIKRDGKELTRSFKRRTLEPGILDKNDNLVETDISQVDEFIQGVCNLSWTSEIKEKWREKLISEKESLLTFPPAVGV